MLAGGKVLAEQDGLHSALGVLERREEPVQEFASALGVVLPGVLAVQDDRDQGRRGGVRRGRLNLSDEIVHRGVGRHVRVREANPVREAMVAEDH